MGRWEGTKLWNRGGNEAKHEGKNHAPPSEAKRHPGGIQNIGIELPIFVEEPIGVELFRFDILIIVM